MVAYAALAAAGGMLIAHPQIRLALWIFLGGLALKTWIAYQRPEE